jgi:phosphoribosyl 1,2-cyclic phosphate phosphodiesterase
MDIMHGDLVITAYRIGEIGYVTDASAIPSDSMHKLQNLDTLVLNALRYKPHPTHFSLEEALSVIADLRPRRAFLVHMTHTLDHASVNAQLPANVQLAYDGLTLEIEDTY